jgi:hypothetical protein
MNAFLAERACSRRAPSAATSGVGMRRRASADSLVALVAGFVAGLPALAIFLASTAARAEAQPHLSEQYLPSSNGIAAIAWDRSQSKLDQWQEHAFQALNATTQSRNFIYDSYPGVRVGTTGTWLSTPSTPTVIEYVAGHGHRPHDAHARDGCSSTSTTSRRWASPSTPASCS